MSESEYLTGSVRQWAEEPWRFVRDVFKVKPDDWQDEALHLIAKRETRRLALKACKGPGKTAFLAWVIWWFLSTRWQAKIGCTSITEGNIDTNLWPELSKWGNRSAFLKAGFEVTRSMVVRRSDPVWFAVKRTWPKSGNAEQQADALAGIHADHVMFVLDESGGIPQGVMVAAEAVLMTEASEAKVVQAGNPTHTTGPLWRACTTDRALWQVVRITGDPDDPKRSPRISLVTANEAIASYGRDNPWVMVNVLGEFPPASINALLGLEEVEAAMSRHLDPPAYDFQQKRLGVDVARFGDDRTVIFPRQGLASHKPIVMRGQRTTDIAARAALALTRWKGELILVDDTGHWGHGVIDNLTTGGYPCLPVVYSAKALNPRYKNRRVEMWLEGAKAIKGGAALPNMPEMVSELIEVTYTFINGVFVLEEKDQVKARLGRSPDLADAYMTTYAIPDMPQGMTARRRRSERAELEFDPFSSSTSPLETDDFDPYNPNI